MADGYARITGRVGVVTAQNALAVTLLVPGLAEAPKASITIVALVQDVAPPSYIAAQVAKKPPHDVASCNKLFQSMGA